MVLIGVAGPASALAREQVAPDSAEAALAEVLADLASQSVRRGSPSAHAWKRSAALLQAAGRLNPSDPRYPRLLVEALLRQGDVQGALDTLAAYRKIEPDQTGVQIQVIDLHLSRMQTADERTDYLSKILRTESLPGPVRSHAAWHLAQLQLERSRHAEATKSLAQAIELNPINVAALRLRYELLPPAATPEQRVAALVPLVEANPAQLDAVLALAEELAMAGLTEESLEFYGIAMDLVPRLGVPFEPKLAHGYAEQLLRSGRTAAAENVLSQWLALHSDDIDAWFMRLLAARQSRNAEEARKISRSAKIAMLNVLAEIRQQAGDTAATTRPVESAEDVAIPDTQAAFDRIKAAGREDLLSAYIGALVDLAWFEIYFDNDPIEAARLIETLRGLLDEGSPTLARLEGWSALVSQRPEEASAKLTAAADRDPLAALGLMRLDPPATMPVNAADLLGANPTGIAGLMIWDALRTKAGPAKATVHASVQRAIEKLDRRRLQILERPGDFYLVRGDPLKISHGFAGPLLVRVTLQNISDHDLSMGSGGIIRPDLWFNAELRGLVQQNLMGIAFDRIDKLSVLPARSSVSQIVRLDQGTLSQFLQANPTISVPIYFSVMTNPTVVADGVIAGPAGQVVQISKVVERKGTPLFGAGGLEMVANIMASGTEAEKIHILDLLATSAQAAGADEATRATADSLADLIERTVVGSSEHVAAWARFLLAVVRSGEERSDVVGRLASSPNWTARLLAAVSSQGLGSDAGVAVASTLAADEDPIVAAYAQALLSEMRQAATQPSATTRPITAPVSPNP